MDHLEPLGLDTPLDAVVFAPTSIVAIEATETKKTAFEQLASEAVTRSGIRFDTLIVHADRCIVQANTVVIPVTTHDGAVVTKDVRGTSVPRQTPLLTGTRHLIVKHVDLNATSVPFRDETHRNRTRKSFACECAMYRERTNAPGANGGDSGNWATPFVYLTEGDWEADQFTVVMDDVGRYGLARFPNPSTHRLPNTRLTLFFFTIRPRPGAVSKAREDAAVHEAANLLEKEMTTIFPNDDLHEKNVAVVSLGEVSQEILTKSTMNQTTSVMMTNTATNLQNEASKEFGVSGEKPAGAGDESNTQRLPGTCGFPRAVAAVQWLASFHAHWWRGLPDSPAVPADTWSRGGYWTLEKRAVDVNEAMDATWAGLLDAFENDPSPEFAAESKRVAQQLRKVCGDDFGKRLRLSAPALARTAQRSEWGTPHDENGGATLVHGDFKAANIVFRRKTKPGTVKPGSKTGEEYFEDDDDQGDETETDSTGGGNGAGAVGSPTVIDWQWTGPGCCAHDLAFFLTTSVSEFSLAKTDLVIEAYHQRLVNDLGCRGDAGRAAASAYSLGRLHRNLTVTYGDYARYLVGDVWRGVTPESLRKNHNRTNFGAHRRSIPHLLFCAEKGWRGLNECERGEPGDDPETDPDAPPPKRDADTPPLRRGPNAKLVAEILGVCVFLADTAGDIIRGVAESGQLGCVLDKSLPEGGEGDKNGKETKSVSKRQKNAPAEPPIAAPSDPQTQADRRAERLICETLRQRFGGVVSVFGEEQLEGGLVGSGAANRDGSVDAADNSLKMTEAALHLAEEFVKDWEILLPQELEVGPRREKELRDANGEKLGKHAACAESDVTVWVDPLDGTREFVEGPEFWHGVTVLIGIAVRGVPVAGVIHQPFVGVDGKPPQTMLDVLQTRADAKAALAAEGWRPKPKTKNPESPDLETFPAGSFGTGRTLWGAPGIGVISHPGRDLTRGTPVPKPTRADVKNLVVCTTRSHQTPFVEGAVYNLHPHSVIRTGGAGGKTCLLLDGKADVWVFPAQGTKRWDTCACEALLSANRGGWLVRATNGGAYKYGSQTAKTPKNADGLLAASDKELYPWMVTKWPWLNEAGGERLGPRDPGLEKE